jgi:hypothetical protein
MIMPGLCSCISFNQLGRCTHRVIKGNVKTQCLRKATYKVGDKRLCDFHQREYLTNSLMESVATPSTSDENEKKLTFRPSLDIESELQRMSVCADIRSSGESETGSTSN